MNEIYELGDRIKELEESYEELESTLEKFLPLDELITNQYDLIKLELFIKHFKELTSEDILPWSHR